MFTIAQVMMKQKNNRNLDARQSMLVESAYYQCNPPQHSALKRKKRPVVQDWMRHLVFVQLGKDDVRKVGCTPLSSSSSQLLIALIVKNKLPTFRA